MRDDFPRDGTPQGQPPMDLTASGRTWEEATSPASTRLARRFESAWRSAPGPRPDPGDFLPSDPGERPGALLALLRTELALRREEDGPVPVEWFLDRHRDLDRDARVALIYEEFCLREEAGETPSPAEYQARFPDVASRLRRVFDIHGLVGTGQTTELHEPPPTDLSFPEAGQTIAGFYLVEELGRGAFARVFLARERQLADRPVALKVARTGSREPQTLARLQHTNIVPVHSYWADPATGLHLMCMPYFGRVTLAAVLADPMARAARTGPELVAALERLHPSDPLATGAPAGRPGLMRRTAARAVAWWGARLAEALGHAHDRGVLHRDIKPSNVLIAGDGMPMLLDFNLAQESWSGAAGAETAALGGTLAYMAPEHLEALADGVSDGVDARSDLYALGVVLFEVLGRRPFATPVGGLTVTDALLRAADERRLGPISLREMGYEVPPALDAVVRKCLEPDPADRYACATDLAADLQAVADDGPLRFAREPQPSRALRWMRRNRRVLALVVPAVLSLAGGLYTLDRIKEDRLERKGQVHARIAEAGRAAALGDFEKAEGLFDSAALVAGQYGLSALRDEAVRGGGEARRTRESRADGDRFLREAAHLRFQLLGFGGNLRSASEALRAGLARFSVLTDPGWTRLPRLEAGPRALLIDEVNELLFLWIVALDLDGERAGRARRAELARLALPVCDRALAFASPKGPWEALRARFASRLEPGRGGADVRARPRPAEERSARACYEWGLLGLLEGDGDRAIAWLERATSLEAGRYWYHFYLAFLDQKAGKLAQALSHYDQAIAIDPESPWARHNRAEVYLSRGAWRPALEDFQRAMTSSREFDVTASRLSRGTIYQQLGDVRAAREDFEEVIRTSGDPRLIRAARLNRAKLDFDAGAADRALRELDLLLDEDPSDANARRGRALLFLRIGRAAQAEEDLDRLLAEGSTPGSSSGDPASRARTLASRAVARLALGRAAESEADASSAFALDASPAHERLWNRTLLAVGRELELRIADPGECADWPAGGGLADDLRAAAGRLRGAADSPGEAAARAARVRALLLSALDSPEARDEADRLVAGHPSALNYATRARVRRRAGDRKGAMDDVERALALEPDAARLLELRGELKAAAGRPRSAIDDYNRALRLGAEGTVRRHRAEAILASGHPRPAVEDWSRSLSFDPEDPRAYLGRARAFARLGQSEQAMADLEQAAGWAGERADLLAPITLAYAACLPERPDRLPRLLSLGRRTWDAWWSSFNLPRGRSPLGSPPR